MIIASTSLVGCTETHHREVDQRLRERFHIDAPPGARLDSAVPQAVLHGVPPGSSIGTVYAYLDAHGFRRHPSDTPSTDSNYYLPLDDSRHVVASMNDYRPHWYSPVDVCDLDDRLIFTFDLAGNLSSLILERHGYCI